MPAPKRPSIDTSLVPPPPSSPSPSPSGSATRRTLHIPNAHPRALSPRSRSSSPLASPCPSPTLASSKSTTLDSSPTQHGQDRPTPTASTPRPRKVRRDGSLISFHASFDERLGVGDNGQREHDQPQGDEEQAGAATSSQPPPNERTPLWRRIKQGVAPRPTLTSADTARDFGARERNFLTWLRLSVLLFILSGTLYFQLRLPSSDPSPPPSEGRDQGRGTTTSLILSAILLVLSLSTLVIGTLDYLRTSRQLQREQVSYDELVGPAPSTSVAYTGVVVVACCLVAAAVVLLVNGAQRAA